MKNLVNGPKFAELFRKHWIHHSYNYLKLAVEEFCNKYPQFRYNPESLDTFEVHHGNFTKETLMDIIKLISLTQPDEIECTTKYLRLWWD
ncbi:hypothetical protein CCP1ISM_3020001 [Azospirillaceae bacterium]